MAKDIRRQISNRIRSLRAKRHMTQQQLAEAADLDYKSIQRLEAKAPSIYPRIDSIEKVAKALGLNLSEFFTK